MMARIEYDLYWYIFVYLNILVSERNVSFSRDYLLSLSSSSLSFFSSPSLLNVSGGGKKEIKIRKRWNFHLLQINMREEIFLSLSFRFFHVANQRKTFRDWKKFCSCVWYEEYRSQFVSCFLYETHSLRDRERIIWTEQVVFWTV